MTLHRGDVYAYSVAGRTRHLLIVSVDMLSAAGTTIVTEIDDRTAISGLLTVPLPAPFDGWHAKTWGLNYMISDRLEAAGKHVGTLDTATMDRITAAIKAAIEP